MVAAAVKAGSGGRRLVVIWSIVALLAGIVVVDEMLERAKESEASVNPSGDRARLLLPLPLDKLHALEVVHGGAIHRFERDAASQWFYHGAHAAAESAHEHPPDPARAKRIDEALQGLDRARRERTLTLDKGIQQYGLAVPQMVILAYGADKPQPLLQLAVGEVAPDGVSRYVLPVGGNAVITIANFQIENLIGLIKAMQVPLPGPTHPKAP